MFNTNTKNFILQLAYQSIHYYFNKQKLLVIDPKNLPDKQLKDLQACFVTLELNGQLRGCIGHIEPIQPLYLDIIENAVASAFKDTRFLPLTKAEFKNIDIQISILTIPQLLEFNDWQDLLSKLKPNIDGVIIKRAHNSATYLPQVWEELPNKEKFLSTLCLKAGLPSGDWKNSGMKVWLYQTEKISN